MRSGNSSERRGDKNVKMWIKFSTRWFGLLISLVLASCPVCPLQCSGKEFENLRKKDDCHHWRIDCFKKSMGFICQTWAILESLKSFTGGFSYSFELGIKFFILPNLNLHLSQGSSSFSRTHVPINCEDHSFFHSLVKRSRVTCCWWFIFRASRELTNCFGPKPWDILNTIDMTMLLYYDLVLLCGKQAHLKYWNFEVKVNNRYHGKQAHLKCMASKLTLNAESKRGMATNLLAQQGTEKEKSELAFWQASPPFFHDTVMRVARHHFFLWPYFCASLGLALCSMEVNLGWTTPGRSCGRQVVCGTWAR